MFCCGILLKTRTYKNDVQLLPKEIEAKVAKLHLPAFDAELLAIRRNSSRIELDVQQFFVLEGSCRSRPALEELDVQQFLAIKGSCRRRISKWKSRAQVVGELPQSPQGTTASTTPPFRRVVCVINAHVPQWYDCVNNATVPQGRLRNQRNVAQKPWGGPPSCDPAPLTTVPPGTVGQWERRHRAMAATDEGAATQKPTERQKGAATQKPTCERRNSLSNLGARGGDPRTPASWRHLLSTSCRGNCWWDGTYTAGIADESLGYCPPFVSSSLR